MVKVLKLRKKEVPYEEIQAPVGQLAFYPENPRIYSQFAGSGDRDPGKYSSETGGHGPRQRASFPNRQGRPGERASLLH